MKRLLAAFAVLAIATTAQAEDKKADKDKAADSQYIAVSPVALPVISDGAVMNYVFVSVRIDLVPSVNALKLREKEPYFRDAMVRAGHRTGFNKPGDLNHVDEARLIAELNRDAPGIIDPGAVKAVKIVSQTPKSWIVSKPQQP